MTAGQLLHDHLWSLLAALNIEVKPRTCREASYYSTHEQSKEKARDNSLDIHCAGSARTLSVTEWEGGGE